MSSMAYASLARSTFLYIPLYVYVCIYTYMYALVLYFWFADTYVRTYVYIYLFGPKMVCSAERQHLFAQTISRRKEYTKCVN